MSPRCVLGIDPGLDGAFALYGPEGLVDVWDIPTLQLKSKRQINECELARLIDGISDQVAEVWLELVASRPGEGSVPSFSFGKGYGLLRGICRANFLPIIDVTPGAWKGALKVRGDKDESRMRASDLMQRSAGRWPLKKHHGRAEASLIALHGFQQSLRLKGAA